MSLYTVECLVLDKKENYKNIFVRELENKQTKYCRREIGGMWKRNNKELCLDTKRLFIFLSGKKSLHFIRDNFPISMEKFGPIESDSLSKRITDHFDKSLKPSV